MPKVFDAGPFSVYFWIGEGDPLEPVHVHVTTGVPAPEDTKFWMTKSGGVVLCHNKGRIPRAQLREIEDMIASQHRLIVSKWQARFGRVSYYC